MKNLGIFISESLFFKLIPLEKTWYSVYSYICFFLIILNLEMVSGELLGPINLLRAKTFGIHKLTEVIVVNKDKNLIFVAFQVVMQSLKDFNNSQKFLIVNLVKSFIRNHLLWQKSYKVSLANFRFRRIRIIFIGHVIGKILI